MRNVTNRCRQLDRLLTRLCLATALASSAFFVSHATAQQAEPVSADTFIPLVSGFEQPDEEEGPTFSLPAPDEQVSLERFKEDYARLKETVDKRLGDLNVDQTFDEMGSDFAGLPGVDVSQYHSELDKQAAVQREIRLLQLRLNQAKVAKELWGVLFGEEVEQQSEERELAMRLALEAQRQDPYATSGAPYQATSDSTHTEEEEITDSTSEATNGPRNLMTTSDGWTLYTEDEGQVYFARASADGSPDFSTVRSVEDLMSQRVSEALATAEKDSKAQHQRTLASLPGVVAVSGVGKSLRARVQDPQFGVLDVTAGESLPNGVRVQAVSPHGVTFVTPDGVKHTAGVGASGLVMR